MPASKLLLIRPTAFSYNPETAASNVFQKKSPLTNREVHAKALSEFDNVVKLLKNCGIEAYIFEDILQNPDSVFPNNWVSFHGDGSVVLYPMLSETRRKERRIDILESLRDEFLIKRIIDLSFYEEEGKFLEGTGSIVFDHRNKTAFAALSPRTHQEVLKSLCDILNYEPVTFRSTDENNFPLYHTNVMMNIADEFAIVCSQSIKDIKQRNQVMDKLSLGGRKIIDINFEQIRCFAGNALAVADRNDQTWLCISKTAADSLFRDQLSIINSACKMLIPDVESIENTGGGSIRCMVSEIYLNLK